MDAAKSKKYNKDRENLIKKNPKRDNSRNLIYISEEFNKNLNFKDYKNNDSKNLNNIIFDTSVYNSYKSVNSNSDKKLSNNNQHFINYYFIKGINEDKDLIIYNDKDSEIKFDENYKCYYSLDHKSKIIYVKTSPKLLSSLSSILNSEIVSNKATKNISKDHSKYSPKNDEINVGIFDHDSIIEKLKNIEILRNDKEYENAKISSSSIEEISDEDN